MTGTIISTAISVVMAVFAAGAFYIAHIERRARRKVNREYMEMVEHERQMAGSVTDANAKKEELQSGDNSADFDAGIDVLHEYAEKKR
ncbi:hypothetical protein HMPREF0860_1593 [Treponema socranskii subsp. socranskii VPI DR56BR1116 = ATCC 35536]|uniref:Uncharacterized protein n=1 Tax=Treponema socranskii subsp. socranskii VPI DR56BR1116 = ATCC 35536 TaxID=1125725 RepID=U2N0Y7_TRESO|nr:hypothetical protein [Treponema socranskii]ERF61775.1 hypothetical protein HMPREF1325_1328 [Treponema socranskii subsp. socranskii VPI DR56BR1116 = ATCC 35536]ERK05084.1 hypothetical protein HMPREF0860_1593 [Treponema socranskii subsp. socranskii VPI DR56BR1116 = ATCC 35536]